jgi:hypothetical protein
LTNLEQVISELDRRKAAIDKALTALRQVSGSPEPKRRGRPPGVDAQTRKGGRRPPATPAESTATATPTKGQVRLTDAGRRRLALSMKKRWAAKRAASEALAKAAQSGGPKKNGVRAGTKVSGNKVALKRTAAKKRGVVKSSAAKKAVRKQSVRVNTVGRKKTGQKLLAAEAAEQQVVAANV